MNLIYFSSLTWDEAGGVQHPAQMARALARRGHWVLFVEPQPSVKRTVDGLPVEIVALTELGISLRQLRRAWYGLDSGDLETFATQLLAHIPKTLAPRATIFSAPLDPLVRLVPRLRANHFAIAYHAMDDFSSAQELGYTQFVPGAEEYLTRYSDTLSAVSPASAHALERFGRHAEIIPNSADLEFWKRNLNAPRLPNLPRGELTLGYWGTLMEPMFDAELVAHVAAARPRWMIHLLGAYDPEPHRPSVVTRLRQLPNVFLHGAVPHADLPRYAAAFDVCLAPFPDNAFTRGRDPLKVYEYLAAHIPVAASYASHLTALPNVQVAQSPDEFIGAIEQAARRRIDIRALDEFLAAQSWDARGEQLEQLLNSVPSATAQTDGAILPTFAEPDAQTVMRYALVLEQELEQVQGWARELESTVQQRGSSLERVKRLLIKN